MGCLGKEGGGSKKHLRSVGLSFLSVPARASVHSVLRLGGVQQHLHIGRHHGDGDHVCNGGDGDHGGDDGDDWEVGGCHLETGDGVQLCRLLINFA